jgi:DNA adenine methylase
MKYMGSKNRHYKEMLPIILQHRKPGQPYVEPFCGGCNMIYKVPSSFPRYANDSHPYLIALLKHVQAGGELPDYVSETEYKAIQNDNNAYPQWLVGFVGFGCSFGAKWFGGFARNIKQGSADDHLNMTTRNYCAESKRNLLAQARYLEGVIFTCGSYQEMFIPPNSLIYCDPPYRGTTGYKDEFDHEALYGWIEARKSEGHTVFISEYDMPPEFKLIGGKRVVASFDHSSRKEGKECLYTL